MPAGEPTGIELKVRKGLPIETPASSPIPAAIIFWEMEIVVIIVEIVRWAKRIQGKH